MLTKELLLKFKACNPAIEFCEKHNLYGLPLSLLDKVEGDHDYFVEWLKTKLSHKIDYDDRGNELRVEYPNGYWVEKKFDSNNITIEETNCDGIHQYWEYNDRGNCTKKQCPTGVMVYLTYDNLNNVIKYETSTGYIEFTSYKENTNLVTRREYGDGTVQEYEYNDHDNIISKTDNGDIIYTIQYEYDENGNITKVSYQGQTLQHTKIYDPYGNIIRYESNFGTGETFEYDHNHNKIKKLYDNGDWVKYVYDIDNILIRTEYSDRTISSIIPDVIEYWFNGQLKQYNKLLIPLYTLPKAEKEKWHIKNTYIFQLIQKVTTIF